jgi:hypothetical protein
VEPRVGVLPDHDKESSISYGIQMPVFVSLLKPQLISFLERNRWQCRLSPQKTVTELEVAATADEDLLQRHRFTRMYATCWRCNRSGSAGDILQYVNKDYSNVKGITFSLTKRRTSTDVIGATLDYTFQVAEGNETDVNAFFLDLSSGRQSEKVPVYLDWDQVHALNANVTGRSERLERDTGRTDWYRLPYTPQITTKTVYLKTNSSRKPSQTRVDLLADKTFAVSGIRLTAFLKVYNLFDTLNERYVYDDTGRATYTLVATQGTAQATDKLATEIPGVHPASEWFVNPSYYSAPREVRVGASVEF